MNIDELLEYSYQIRSKFLNEISENIENLHKKGFIKTIYQIYNNHMQDLIADDEIEFYADYFDSLYQIKRLSFINRTKAYKRFLALLFQMTANLHNAAISKAWKHGNPNTDSFFSGFDIYECQMEITEAKDFLMNNFPNDIDLLELLDTNDEDELTFILEKQYLDVYIVQRLAMYRSIYSVKFLYDQLLFYRRVIKDFQNEPIYKLSINLFKTMKI